MATGNPPLRGSNSAFGTSSFCFLACGPSNLAKAGFQPALLPAPTHHAMSVAARLSCSRWFAGNANFHPASITARLCCNHLFASCTNTPHEQPWHPPAEAPFVPAKLATPMLSRVSWKGSEIFFFSRVISVVPSRLTWDGLSSWGLSKGVGMGQEEEARPQPEPLCRHFRVSVLACLPVS